MKPAILTFEDVSGVAFYRLLDHASGTLLRAELKISSVKAWASENGYQIMDLGDETELQAKVRALSEGKA